MSLLPDKIRSGLLFYRTQYYSIPICTVKHMPVEQNLFHKPKVMFYAEYVLSARISARWFVDRVGTQKETNLHCLLLTFVKNECFVCLFLISLVR